MRRGRANMQGYKEDHRTVHFTYCIRLDCLLVNSIVVKSKKIVVKESTALYRTVQYSAVLCSTHRLRLVGVDLEELDVGVTGSCQEVFVRSHLNLIHLLCHTTHSTQHRAVLVLAASATAVLSSTNNCSSGSDEHSSTAIHQRPLCASRPALTDYAFPKGHALYTVQHY